MLLDVLVLSWYDEYHYHPEISGKSSGILLKDLHAEHLGMVKMKQLARKYMWWPKLDKEIEETVKWRRQRFWQAGKMIKNLLYIVML